MAGRRWVRVCVGCEREREDVQRTFIGLVCADCRPLLKDVLKWQHVARTAGNVRVPKVYTVARPK